ncbi:hypothetical protein C2E23DRAFT_715465, partial [Lenzites betulinus]
DTMDGGVATVAARTKRPRRPQLLSADEKRARFRAKYAGKTHEEVLAIISQGWRSSVYKHFRPPVIVPGPNGCVAYTATHYFNSCTAVYRFVCKKYPSKHVDRIDYEDSTGNLKCHGDCCDPDDTPRS